MLKNFCFITSVRPIVHDTYKTAKINFINSRTVDIIRTVYLERVAFTFHLLLIIFNN